MKFFTSVIVAALASLLIVAAAPLPSVIATSPTNSKVPDLNTRDARRADWRDRGWGGEAGQDWKREARWPRDNGWDDIPGQTWKREARAQGWNDRLGQDWKREAKDEGWRSEPGQDD